MINPFQKKKKGGKTPFTKGFVVDGGITLGGADTTTFERVGTTSEFALDVTLSTPAAVAIIEDMISTPQPKGYRLMLRASFTRGGVQKTRDIRITQGSLSKTGNIVTFIPYDLDVALEAISSRAGSTLLTYNLWTAYDRISILAPSSPVLRKQIMIGRRFYISHPKNLGITKDRVMTLGDYGVEGSFPDMAAFVDDDTCPLRVLILVQTPKDAGSVAFTTIYLFDDYEVVAPKQVEFRSLVAHNWDTPEHFHRIPAKWDGNTHDSPGELQAIVASARFVNGTSSMIDIG